MEYFMSHILYIALAGIIIAFVCAAWVFFAEKTDDAKRADGDLDADWTCNMGCHGCANSGSCIKEQKKETLQ